MGVDFRVETATAVDLDLLQAWSSWLPGRDVPCVVGGDRPREVFDAGSVRVICAVDGSERVGISLVADPSAALQVSTWPLTNNRSVPADECLVWMGIAVSPGRRQSGLAQALVRRTLEMAATTGYPYIAAVFPVQDARASALLVRSGFVRVDHEACSGESRIYCAYVAATPALSADSPDTELAS